MRPEALPFAQKNGGYGRTAAPFACGDETFLPPSRTELFGGTNRDRNDS